jgi:hypothetical protein
MSLLYNSVDSQSQRIDLARNSLEQVRGQKPDGSDDAATTTTAQVFGRLLIGVMSKSDTQSYVTRVFHGIYATTTTS